MHCPQPQLLAFVCLFVCSQNRFCAKTISSVDLWVGGWAHPQTSTDIISSMLQGLNLLIASFTFLSYMSYVGQPDAAHSGIYYWWCVSLDYIQFRNVANTVVGIVIAVFFYENQVTNSGGAIVCKYIHKDWDDSWLWKMPSENITETRYTTSFKGEVRRNIFIGSKILSGPN